MRLNQQLAEALAAHDANRVHELAALVRATWFDRVAAARKDWPTSDIKSDGQYAKAFERLAKKAGTRQPDALLKFAQQQTGSQASLRAYRAAIKHMAAKEAKEEFYEILREADRNNSKARKLAKDIEGLANSMATIATGLVYEKKIDACLAKLEGLSEMFEQAKGMKAEGKRKQRSHQQRSRLDKLPDDWQDRMLARMKKGRKGAEGKWAAHAAATILTGARPCELSKLVFYREGPLLVLLIKGGKVGEVTVPSKPGKHARGQEERELVFDMDKLGGAYREAALQLYAKADPRGHMTSLSDAKSFGSAWRAAAARELGDAAPSAYANRHQFASELKARAGKLSESDAGGLSNLHTTIAKAMGHISERSSKVYGRPALSKLNGLDGLIAVDATNGTTGSGGGDKPSVKRTTKAQTSSKAMKNPLPRPKKP